MTYKMHEPDAREKEIIDVAYAAQRSIKQTITRFVMPVEVQFTPISDDGSAPNNEAAPFGEIVMEGVEIRGKDHASPRDGFWDKITYDGEEWLVKGSLVLKNSTHSKERCFMRTAHQSFWHNYRVFRRHMAGKSLRFVSEQKPIIRGGLFAFGIRSVGVALAEVERSNPDWLRSIKLNKMEAKDG